MALNQMAAVSGVVCGSHQVQGRCVAPVTNIIAIGFWYETIVHSSRIFLYDDPIPLTYQCAGSHDESSLYALKLSTRCTKRKTTKGAIDQYV